MANDNRLGCGIPERPSGLKGICSGAATEPNVLCLLYLTEAGQTATMPTPRVVY
jgi:hypothetical protein